jgi:cystathionine beta-lyase
MSEAELRRRNSVKWTKYAPDVLPAWIADMDFHVAEPVRQSILRAVQASDFGYPSESLVGDFAMAFVERMRARHDWAPSAERIVPVTDLVQALTAAVGVFCKPGAAVVVQTPIYPPFLNSVRNNGRPLVECPVEDSNARGVIDLRRLRAAITRDTRMLLLCNPHNPTGMVFSRAELAAVAELADAHDLIVVSDEIHSDLVLDAERVHVPFESIGASCARRAITISSATKAFNIAGLRAGLMHFGSEDLLDTFRRAFPDRLLGQVSGIGMQATIAAWTHAQDWLDRILAQLRANRDALAAQLRRDAPQIEFRPSEATYLQWLDCTRLGLRMPADEFFVQHAKVALNGGQAFGTGFGGFVRLNFATSPAILAEIAGRMAHAVRGSRA